MRRARAFDRRLYYALLVIIAAPACFMLFAIRTLRSNTRSPPNDVGRQAFEAAFERQDTRIQAQSNLTSAGRPPLVTYFDPSVWDPNTANPTPLTEIGVKACLWPPSVWDVCTIDSTPREDASRGPWVRVDRDLDRRVGIYYNFVFYRRRPAYSTLPSIVDIKLLTTEESERSPLRDQLRSEGWYCADGDLRSGDWPRLPSLRVWYLTQALTSTSTKEPFTELDVVYGLAGLRQGWEGLGIVSDIPKHTPVSLVGRRRPTASPSPPDLFFSKEGNFTILQLADFHFSTENGTCRDTNNLTACPSGQDADVSSMVFLNRAIDQVKPDLIVLSGDQCGVTSGLIQVTSVLMSRRINGQGTSWAAQSAILKFARIFANRTVPWAAVFGNHDDEDTDASRSGQMAFMETMPYFVGSAGPASVDGIGNYVLKLKSADPSHTHIFTVYALDSHAYANTLFTSSYDYIKESQIQWFKQESANIKMLLRPYQAANLSTESGMFDIGGILRRFKGHLRRQVRGQTLKKPNAIAFWHIPLPEHDHATGLPVDMDPVNRAPLVIGEALELSGGGPRINSHFFDALTSRTEIGTPDEISSSSGTVTASSVVAIDAAAPEVKITAHGHQHLRASCERRQGIWGCFAGGSTYSGYGKTFFDRRVRIFRISDHGETVETWQLVDSSATTNTSAAPSASAAPQRTRPLPGIIGELAAEAQAEAELEEEVLQELVDEGDIELATPPSEEIVRRQRQAIQLKAVDRAVLVGRGALGT